MTATVSGLLPQAIGVALSPIPVVAAILMLLSANARRAGTGFALGWVAGILAATGLATAAAASGLMNSAGHPSAAASVLKTLIGLLLVVIAVRQWRSRADDSQPAWMKAIDELGVAKAAGLGLVLSLLNPKNLLLCVSAGVTIGTAGLSPAAGASAITAFVLLGAASVVVPVGGYAVAANQLRGGLARLKNWLQANNHTVIAVVFLVMGSTALVKGVSGF
ncbi:GAP family protein [Nocardia stercoris]|uniref:GAP family protein n=1 Tax=Nocardia stercoris TaxID=2483361 RepID=A0A3M2KX45_9NOCA|nr:GAP family protein [Nocardia stercoris]RMI29010.1 GAP family protein [Nocardia stercoris]